MNKIAISTLLSLLVATPGIAADMYVGVKAGIAHHVQDSYQNVGVTSNNDQSGTGIFAGYKINEMYSIEAEYTKLGGFDIPSGTIKSSAVGISGVAWLPIKKQFSAVGKLGIAKSSMENAAAPGHSGQVTTHKNTGMLVGLGFQYNVTPAAGIQGGIDMYQEGDASSPMYAACLWYVGGVFKF